MSLKKHPLLKTSIKNRLALILALVILPIMSAHAGEPDGTSLNGIIETWRDYSGFVVVGSAYDNNRDAARGRRAISDFEKLLRAGHNPNEEVKVSLRGSWTESILHKVIRKKGEAHRGIHYSDDSDERELEREAHVGIYDKAAVLLLENGAQVKQRDLNTAAKSCDASSVILLRKFSKNLSLKTASDLVDQQIKALENAAGAPSLFIDNGYRDLSLLVGSRYDYFFEKGEPEPTGESVFKKACDVVKIKWKWLCRKDHTGESFSERMERVREEEEALESARKAWRKELAAELAQIMIDDHNECRLTRWILGLEDEEIRDAAQLILNPVELSKLLVSQALGETPLSSLLGVSARTKPSTNEEGRNILRDSAVWGASVKQ